MAKLTYKGVLQNKGIEYYPTESDHLHTGHEGKYEPGRIKNQAYKLLYTGAAGGGTDFMMVMTRFSMVVTTPS